MKTKLIVVETEAYSSAYKKRLIEKKLKRGRVVLLEKKFDSDKRLIQSMTSKTSATAFSFIRS